MNSSIDFQALTLGVCYYPEHWNESLWQDDLRRMKEHGIEIVRIGEFAWNLMEIEEGVFDFSFWDKFLLLAEQEDMKVIFCTPTATPPAWLTNQYPEVLNADGDGHLMYHGIRGHYSLNSAKYHELCSRLVEKLGKHINQYSCVIGWQIDNEVNCSISDYYSDNDHMAFREYLKEKYVTLEHFNQQMGTVFWNQGYSDWSQVYLARRTPNGLGKANPHLMLEEKRFISHSAIHFIAMQANILSKTKGNRFITTNGLFAHLDYHKLMESGIDFICYDNYPNFSYGDGVTPDPDSLRDRNSSFNMARTRSISPLFGIMEQQSGPGGWNFAMMQPAPKPGQMRLWTWQAFAHGADMVSYFRWRTCDKGTEIYWHGLNDYSNEPNRRMEELLQIKEDLQKVNDWKCGAAGKPYQAKAAILTDYDNTWDGESDIWHGPLRDFSVDGWFRAFQHMHIPFDFVDIRNETTLEDLSKYELIVYPHATLISEERVAVLEQYANQGGTLIFGCRTGYKNLVGQCPMEPMPGPLGRLCGIKVTDFTFVGPLDEDIYMEWKGNKLPAPKFNDIIEPLPTDENKAVIQGIFLNNYYAGKGALSSKTCGKGSVWYLGAGFAEETAAFFLKELGFQNPLKDILSLPKEVEIAIRGTNSIAFLLNYKPEPMEIMFHKPTIEILSGEKKMGTHNIPPYGVWILDLEQ